MKSMLLTTTAMLMLSFATAHALVPSLDITDGVKTAQASALVQLASGDDNDSDGDDHGGGNDGGGHHGGGHDDGDNDDDRDDDNGGGGDDDDLGASNDDLPGSNSNRRKARVPGGSGCDDTGDIVEHAECRP